MSFSFGAPKTDTATTPKLGFGNAAGDFKNTNKPASSPVIPFLGHLRAQPAIPAVYLDTATTAVSAAPTFGFPANTLTSTGFGFGTTAVNTYAPVNFSLGNNAASTLTGINFGAPAVAPTVTVTTTSAPVSSGFTLGGLTTATTGYPYEGTPAAATSVSLNFGGTTSTTATSSAPILSFGLSGTTASATPTFSLNSTASTTTISKPALTLGAPTTAPTTKLVYGLTFGTPATSLPTTSSTGYSIAAISNAPTAVITTATTVSSGIPASGMLTFMQLEDAINKWTIDLEEQGKLFVNQAKQLNAWDRLLITNGEKVLSLNNGIERVKQQQQQLDQELDFILAQQKELEDLIIPLEKELQDVPITDLDRNHTYQLAENMDTQLKQMSEDLKEVIEQLNESNKSQEISNPITQIGRILNAHMNSLQWVDTNTAKISTHLDQISKMHDLNRKSHEKNLQRTYD